MGLEFNVEESREMVSDNKLAINEVLRKLETLYQNQVSAVEFYRKDIDFTIELGEDLQQYFQMLMETLQKLEDHRQALEKEIEALSRKKGLVEQAPEYKETINTADVYNPNEYAEQQAQPVQQVPASIPPLASNSSDSLPPEQPVGQSDPIIQKPPTGKPSLKDRIKMAKDALKG